MASIDSPAAAERIDQMIDDLDERSATSAAPFALLRPGDAGTDRQN